MNNAQAALIASTITCGPNGQGIFALAERYRQWLEGKDAEAAKREAAGLSPTVVLDDDWRGTH